MDNRNLTTLISDLKKRKGYVNTLIKNTHHLFKKDIDDLHKLIFTAIAEHLPNIQIHIQDACEKKYWGGFVTNPLATHKKDIDDFHIDMANIIDMLNVIKKKIDITFDIDANEKKEDAISEIVKCVTNLKGIIDKTYEIIDRITFLFPSESTTNSALKRLQDQLKSSTITATIDTLEGYITKCIRKKNQLTVLKQDMKSIIQHEKSMSDVSTSTLMQDYDHLINLLLKGHKDLEQQQQLYPYPDEHELQTFTDANKNHLLLLNTHNENQRTLAIALKRYETDVKTTKKKLNAIREIFGYDDLSSENHEQLKNLITSFNDLHSRIKVLTEKKANILSSIEKNIALIDHFSAQVRHLKNSDISATLYIKNLQDITACLKEYSYTEKEAEFEYTLLQYTKAMDAYLTAYADPDVMEMKDFVPQQSSIYELQYALKETEKKDWDLIKSQNIVFSALEKNIANLRNTELIAFNMLKTQQAKLQNNLVNISSEMISLNNDSAKLADDLRALKKESNQFATHLDKCMSNNTVVASTIPSYSAALETTTNKLRETSKAESLLQQKEIYIQYVNKQLWEHSWEVSQFGGKNALMFDANALQNKICTVPNHVRSFAKSITLFTRQTGEAKTYAQLINTSFIQLKGASDTAFNSTHLFRKDSTAKFYRETHRDFRVLDYIAELSLTHQKEIGHSIQDDIESMKPDGHDFSSINSLLQQETATAYDWGPRLVSLYTENQRIFHQPHTTDHDRLLCYNLLQKLSGIDAEKTLENIIESIIDRSLKNRWSTWLGGIPITIAGSVYKVPAKVAEIFNLIASKNNLTSAVEKLSAVMLTAWNASAQSSFFRHDTTQQFYQDIAAGLKYWMTPYHPYNGSLPDADQDNISIIPIPNKRRSFNG